MGFIALHCRPSAPIRRYKAWIGNIRSSERVAVTVFTKVASKQTFWLFASASSHLDNPLHWQENDAKIQIQKYKTEIQKQKRIFLKLSPLIWTKQIEVFFIILRKKSTKLTNYVMAQITCSIHWFPINLIFMKSSLVYASPNILDASSKEDVAVAMVLRGNGYNNEDKDRCDVENSSNHSYPHPSRSDCWSLDPNTSSLSISAMASTHSISLAISLSSFPLFFSFLVKRVERKAHLIPTCCGVHNPHTVWCSPTCRLLFFFLQLYSL